MFYNHVVRGILKMFEFKCYTKIVTLFQNVSVNVQPASHYEIMRNPDRMIKTLILTVLYHHKEHNFTLVAS